MFAGARITAQDKRKAYTVAGAFFTDCIQPYVTDQSNTITFERASVTKRGQWLGQFLHEMGWRNAGEVDYEADKDISDLPVVNYNEDAANWRKTVAQWRSIVPELCEPVHSFLLMLPKTAGWEEAFLAATGMPAVKRTEESGRSTRVNVEEVHADHDDGAIYPRRHVGRRWDLLWEQFSTGSRKQVHECLAVLLESARHTAPR